MPASSWTGQRSEESKLDPTKQTAKSTQNTWLLSAEAISHTLKRPLPLRTASLKSCFVLFPCLHTWPLSRTECGLSGGKLSCERGRGLDCRIRLASQSQARLCRSLLMPRRTEAELKRCSQCDSPCEGLVQGLLERL